MTEIGKQRWVTYASGDVEGVKALLLARSLRRVITTRSSIIFVSYEVSEDICELLQNEFDSCHRIGKKQMDLYPNQPFSAIVKAKCFGLTRLAEFVFLDCNCVVLKNSDELFKKIGCGLVPAGNNGSGSSGQIACVIAARPTKLLKSGAGYKNKKELRMSLNIAAAFQRQNGSSFEGGKLLRLDAKYSVSVDLKRIALLNGTNIKIACFTGAHPLDALVKQKTNGSNGHEIGLLEKGLLEYCMDLFATDGLKEKVEQLFQIPERLRILSMPKNGNGICKSVDSTDMHLEDLKDSIAIVGMSFRFPGANNVDEFWDLLVNGKDGIIKVPEWRWNKDQCFIRGDNTRDTQAGFLKCPIDKIDGKFFGMTPAELSYMDPQQRLALQVVWEGLEHACISPVALKNSNTGVFGGWWRNDYKEMLQEAGLSETEFFRAYMGNALGTMTSRISHCLELTGPSISTESGCSTSIVSVDMACNSLRSENCDIGLAVGVNLLLHPFSIDAMNAVVAMDGHCKTFDAKADGFGRAEGCAVLVLKRFADAVESGDRIWGLIRGSAVVQEGPSRSLGTPTKQCEALAMQLALARAGVEPHEVSFVETHGTGTPVGDPLEVAAMAEVYSKGRTEPLTIGSVKTNIGHTESVSGIAGIVKTVLSMRNEIIPPHLNLEELNPEINLETIPAIIPMTAQPWKKDASGIPRIAGVSSFGITGTDAHVIVQETPEFKTTGLPIYDSRTSQVLTISAKSQEGLDELLVTYKNFLKKTDEELLNIGYTSNIGRGHFQHRLAVVGTNNSEILQKLDKHGFEMKAIASETPKVCFLFTGQGSQYPGMAKKLYETSPVFKSHFDYSELILKQKFGLSLKNVIWGNESDQLSRTLFSQTSIFCIEFCLLKLWESWGVKPDIVLGHSLGEYSAAVAAGILTFEDALTLVVERSRLIDALPQGQMLVVREPLETVEVQLKNLFKGTSKFLDIAAVNSPDQTVLSGSNEVAQEFMEYCKSKNIEARIIPATHAFHSHHMDPMLEEFGRITSTVAYQDPQNNTCTYISGMTGCVIEEAENIGQDYWVRHTRERVRFIDATKTVLDNECTIFLEIGPHPVLSALTLINASTMDIISPVCLPSIRKNQDDWDTILTTLSKLYVNGLEIDWENFHRYSQPKKIDLPHYPFQEKSYWMEVKDDGNIPIHPLVGCPISNPSALKIFRSNIDVYRTTFLKDHVIGNRLIFPGAGFLESCLCAGHAGVQCTEGGYFSPVSPLSIENFLIEAPLCLSETGRNQLQTVLSSEDSGETRVTIYSKLTLDKDTHKWIRHASAKFYPFALKWEGEDNFARGTLDDIRARCNEKLTTDQTYSKLEEFGLKFGPTFQTLRGAWKGVDELCFEIEVTDDPKRFVCHPVIIDAMFQAIMIGTYSDAENKLHVPISVNKFIWYAKIETKTCYIYSHKPEDSTADITVLLFDSNGKLLAVMIGAEFLETTVTNIMSMIEAQRMPFPSMFEDVWRDQLGPLEKRIPPEVCYNSRKLIFSQFFMDSYKKYNIFDDEQKLFFDRSNYLYLLYMINALKKLGWNAKSGDSVELNPLAEFLRVQSNIKGLLRYILLVLVEEGYLSVSEWDLENMKFLVLKDLPKDRGQILNEIETLYKDLDPEVNSDIQCVSVTGNVLGELLTGEQSPLPLLFPEDPNSRGPAELFYCESSKMRKPNCQIVNSVCGLIVDELKAHLKESKNVLRILEVGAGTGSFTELFLAGLDGNPAWYEYTYTDVSPVFFSKGEKIFENNKIKVHYKVLNIEEDPASQGFIPHHYDIVIASFVIHATRDMQESISNLRNLVRPEGFLLITELTKPYRAINLLFGALEGFWRFTDHDLRPYNCEMNVRKWDQILKKHDFENVAAFPSFEDHSAFIIATASTESTYVTRYQTPSQVQKSWIVFSEDVRVSQLVHDKLSQMGKTVHLVRRSTDGLRHFENDFYIRGNEPTDMVSVFDSVNSQKNKELEGVIYLWGLDYKNETDYTTVCQPFLTLSKIVGSYDHKKVLVFTRGLLNAGDHQITIPSASPLIGMAKALQNENPALSCRCIDLDPSSSSDSTYCVDEALTEMLTSDGEPVVAYRNGQRLVSRFVSLKVPNTALAFPKSEAFHLILPPTNALSDLRFGPMDKIQNLGDNQVEVRVVSYALNFKDLLTVLKPEAMFEKMTSMGIDYAGVITAIGSKVTAHKIGDPVIGANLDSFGEALPSHQYSDEDLLIPIPNWMTFCEGATLPAVAATAYICLVEVAKIKEGDTVLIHTGSGGVGLCAIQLAKSKKCNIITTAGSERKRKFLRDLGIKHVFHSRNTNYEKDIRNALGGKGVDVVLNSLTSPGFKEATLSVCNEEARFIEMSKLNVWSKEEVSKLRPDVMYQIVDLLNPEQSKIKENMQKIKKFVKESTIKPIPYVRFDASEIREALIYLQKAKHIGKIVCVMPEKSLQNGSSEFKTPLFSDRSSYLITGGLGGIGIEIAKWMATSGAKHIVLVGRSPPKDKALEDIKKMTSQGCNIIVQQCDVGDFEKCKELLDTLKSEEINLPPLRGIMHAAGVLSDGALATQTWEKFETAFNAKIKGGWNLHKLTLDYPLEHFVMFSSAAANFGSFSQSNHAAANTYLDCLAAYRYGIGLPSMTVNWGQWGQVGVAAELDLVAFRPFTVLQGVSALEKAMKCNRLQTSVIEADFNIVKKAFAGSKKYLEELKMNQNEKVSDIGINADQFWKEYDSSESRQEKYEIVRKFIQLVIRHTLRMDPDEKIDDDASFQDMGMDSLMMIEMKNSLQISMGKRVKITVNSVRDCKNVRELSHRLVELISGEEELPPPTREELVQWIREDSELAAEIKPDENTISKKPSEIQTVLITGVTGNFGPYILRELSKRTNITKIYCLMRDTRILTPKERLKQILTEKKMLTQIRFDDVECLTGDVAKPNLGLSQDLYNELVENVDAVFHLSVKAAIDEFYRKIEDPTKLENVRTANVTGTINIIQFACSKRLKHVFHASTTIATSKLDEDERLWESWPSVDEFDNRPNSGYYISKFICDRLMAQAVERGLPCKVFRFPCMGGDSVTGGNISILNNHLLLRMMAYMYLGKIPAQNVPLMIVPIDICAELSIKVFFRDDVTSDIFNVSNPYVNDELELEDIAQDFGFSIEAVEPDEFIETVSKIEGGNEIVDLVKRATSRSGDREEMEDNVPELYEVWIRNKQGDTFLSKKLVQLIQKEYPSCMQSSLSLLKKDLQYAKDSGAFEKVGLKIK